MIALKILAEVILREFSVRISIDSNIPLSQIAREAQATEQVARESRFQRFLVRLAISSVSRSLSKFWLDGDPR